MSCFTKLAKSQAPADFLLGRCSAREAPLFTSNPELPGEDEEALLASVRTLEPVQWDRTTPFVQSFTQAGKPALLRGTVVDGWAARNWTWEHLRRLHAGQTLVDVLETDGHHYLSPDKKAAFEPLLRYHVPQRWRNMSADTFFDVMDAAQARFEAEGYERTAAVRALWRAGGARYVHFAPVEGAMTHDVEPRELLFADKEDLRNGMQSVWVSTPGVRTHTHFDSDHNVFVQLLGRKRFVMWPPNQTDALCMFPRLHPLWHKSRVDFERPDFAQHAPCARYNTSEAVAVDVGPGDVLYVPPFWWHTVETLSPSVSLTTLSRYHLLYNRMQGIYRMTYHFDKLAHYDARVYSLRAFLVLLVRRMLQHDEGADARHAGEAGFFARLAERYDGFEHLFQHEEPAEAETLCGLGERGTPSCNNCLANVKADATIVWDEHFRHLPAAVRRPLFDDYVEELTSWVVGAGKALPFWRRCFVSEKGALRFFKTHKNSEEHARLWQEIYYG